MADSKISALPASTTPLAGTEVLPIVQSSTTKQVSVANLTAGRAISATQITLTAGNVIPASGFGIDFSATAGSGSSELLDDYEEGTWTPTIIGLTTAGTGTYSAQIAYYTKTGRQVTVYGRVGITNHTGTGNMAIGNLPYPLELSYASGSIVGINLTVNATSYPVILMVGLNSTIIYVEQVAIATGTSASIPMDTSCDLYFSITYFAAS